MIPFITSFKSFVGQDKQSQRSALYSWRRENARAFTCINESNIVEGCFGYNMVYVNKVRTAKDIQFNNNAVLIKDLILRSLESVQRDPVVFINGDIIITPGFHDKLFSLWDKYGPEVFMTGTRYGVDIDSEIESDEAFKKALELPREPYNETDSSDIFIASRMTFRKMAEDMSDMIMGRYGWDNWIHYWAEAHPIKKINCTHSLVILHANHDYTHIENQEGAHGRKAPSSVHNLLLLRNMQALYGQSTVRINKWEYAEI